MITRVPDPLLAITVSTTLRHKPLAITPPRKTLAALVDAAGGLQSARNSLASPIKANGANDEHGSDSEDEILTGLQEVNLLEGLTSGMGVFDVHIRPLTHAYRADIHRSAEATISAFYAIGVQYTYARVWSSSCAQYRDGRDPRTIL